MQKCWIQTRGQLFGFFFIHFALKHIWFEASFEQDEYHMLHFLPWTKKKQDKNSVFWCITSSPHPPPGLNKSGHVLFVFFFWVFIGREREINGSCKQKLAALRYKITFATRQRWLTGDALFPLLRRMLHFPRNRLSTSPPRPLTNVALKPPRTAKITNALVGTSASETCL